MHCGMAPQVVAHPTCIGATGYPSLAGLANLCNGRLTHLGEVGDCGGLQRAFQPHPAKIEEAAVNASKKIAGPMDPIFWI